MSTITLKNVTVNGEVFGKIKANAVSNVSIDNLYEETIFHGKKLELVSKFSGKGVYVDLHDIFMEKSNKTNCNEACFTFVVSVSVESDNEQAVLKEARLKFSKAAVDFIAFNLKDCGGTYYDFTVLEWTNEWEDFLEEC